jgi:hypothetical protein
LIHNKNLFSNRLRWGSSPVLPESFSYLEGEWYCPSCTEERANEEKLRAYGQRMLKLHWKDGAILRSEKYYGVDMLLNAAETLSKDEKMVIPQK